ncbi:MAG: DAK2 domain-containing protein [Lachnospiraceae bacterium]|nr:DAK2 domain-containing protein [Lachnospiraceae bacterium]
MALLTVDAALLRKMFLAGAKNLESKKEIINELNVFPVPDGDTGTNMTLTILSAVKEVQAAQDQSSMKALSKAMSSGSLKGARGNSGVILSQLLRGFSKVVGNYDQITIPIAAESFAKAVDTAYNAVMKPKEGTILTVARAGAERAAELVGVSENFEDFTTQVVQRMQEALDYTPELLPVLKEAGVVDSGGQGLLEVMRGGLDCMLGKEVDLDFESGTETKEGGKSAKGAASDTISTADIKFGYCTEFIIKLERTFSMADEAAFKAYLSSIGDSLVCVADDDIVKVHVHTNDPGLAIQKALTFGQLTRMKIDNMREEHNERVIMSEEKAAAEAKEPAKDEPRKQYGFVAVSVGEGMNAIFRELGVDCIIEGGQTMNPSTEDMLTAVAKVNADHVFILPNNKNIILAADQAKYLEKEKEIIVIPTKTVPQGISAVIAFNPELSAEENLESMKEALGYVKSGQVTYAVRDTSIDGHEIHESDIMGISDKGIVAVGKNIEDTTLEMIETMVDEESGLLSIYYGSDITEEDAQGLADRFSEKFPLVDVEIHSGGQPIYYYVVSVE